MPARAVHLDLVVEREGHGKFAGAELLDLLVAARFLPAELVAREAEDGKALVRIFSVVVLIVTAIAFILTFQPDKRVKIRPVSYDEISFVIQKTHAPSENDIAANLCCKLFCQSSGYCFQRIASRH